MKSAALSIIYTIVPSVCTFWFWSYVATNSSTSAHFPLDVLPSAVWINMAMRVLVGCKRVIDYAVKVRFLSLRY